MDNVFIYDSSAFEVKNDVNEAKQIGVTGVPFFVFDRKYAVSGAQPPEITLNKLNTAFNNWQQNSLTIVEGQSCNINAKCD